MAAFNFRLQPVLNIKIQKEKNLENELGKAVQKLEAEKLQLLRLESSLNEMVSEFNKKTKKSTVHTIIEFNGYISVLNSKIKSQKEIVNCAALNVDKIREQLLTAVKDRKILDKLKENKHEEYLLEQKRLEQKTNDEITSYKHNVAAREIKDASKQRQNQK
jgi:flagellar FliJ protein